MPAKLPNTCAFTDGGSEVCWKGASIPYSAFGKNQNRVIRGTITENTHLDAVMEHNKTERDQVATRKNRSADKLALRNQLTGKHNP